MAAVDGNGYKLEDDIGAKITGLRKEYDNDRDNRDEFGTWNIFNLFEIDYRHCNTTYKIRLWWLQTMILCV